MTWPRSVWFTRHALDRLEEHYGQCNHEDGWRILDTATELTPVDAVLRVVGRHAAPPGAAPSRYFLPVERMGILVIEHGEARTEGAALSRHWRELVCVTYLRLAWSQRAIVDKVWPGPGAATDAATPEPLPVLGPMKQEAPDLVRIALSSVGRWATARELGGLVGVKPARCTEVLGELRGSGEVECLIGVETHWRLRPRETST